MPPYVFTRFVLLRLLGVVYATDADLKTLLAHDPFPDAPPRFVRAELWRYRFTRPGDGASAWWRRSWTREYLRPVSLDDAALRRAVGVGN